MTVGGLGNVIISPVFLNVGERGKFFSVFVHEAFVSFTAQHIVRNSRYLRAGDGVIRPERAIAIAADPALLDGIYHGVIEPVVLVHIGKDVLTFSNAHSKLHGDGGEFGAGDGTLRFKVAVAYAGHNA